MTLTEMLQPICEDKLAVQATKEVFKLWLSQIAIGGDNTPEKQVMRKMLMILVDEP
jgi:hypothetical protein